MEEWHLNSLCPGLSPLALVKFTQSSHIEEEVSGEVLKYSGDTAGSRKRKLRVSPWVTSPCFSFCLHRPKKPKHRRPRHPPPVFPGPAGEGRTGAHYSKASLRYFTWIWFYRHLNSSAYISLVKSASRQVKQALRCWLCEQKKAVGMLQESEERPGGWGLINS